MAHPEHDAALGRLAAARLRAASAEVRLDAHPDAEAWAAYLDGGLVADEVAGLEAHLAACGACRQLVAALAPEPADSAPAVEIEATPGPARVLPFRPRVMWVSMSIAAGLLGAVTIWSVTRLQQPPMAATMAERTASAPDAGAASRPSVEPTTSPAAPPADAVRHATPLGSSAATPPQSGAAASPRADELDRAKSALEKKVAAGADDRDRAAEALREARARAAVDVARAPKPEAAGGGATANEQVVVTQSAPPAPAAAAARAPATPGVHGPAVNTQQQNMQALNAQMQARSAQVAAAQAAEQEKARAGTPAEVPRQAAVSAPPVARPGPPPPAPEPQAVGEVAEIVSGPPAAAAPSGARRQGFGEAKRDVAALRERAEPPLADAEGFAPAITFGEPDGRLRWRIAGGSRIESSSDAGATWNARYTATSRLRAGSAPAIDTAWVVGDGGLVLRFAVPGTWTPVNRPTTATLVGVTAGSADAARVTAEDGRVFATTDGGRSWTPTEGTGVPPR